MVIVLTKSYLKLESSNKARKKTSSIGRKLILRMSRDRIGTIDYV